MAELDELVRFDSTVTVVDALNLDAALAGGPIAFDQIRAADVVVLNKPTWRARRGWKRLSAGCGSSTRGPLCSVPSMGT
jgi:G3E family GTPase